MELMLVVTNKLFPSHCHWPFRETSQMFSPSPVFCECERPPNEEGEVSAKHQVWNLISGETPPSVTSLQTSLHNDRVRATNPQPFPVILRCGRGLVRKEFPIVVINTFIKFARVWLAACKHKHLILRNWKLTVSHDFIMERLKTFRDHTC